MYFIENALFKLYISINDKFWHKWERSENKHIFRIGGYIGTFCRCPLQKNEYANIQFFVSLSFLECYYIIQKSDLYDWTHLAPCIRIFYLNFKENKCFMDKIIVIMYPYPSSTLSPPTPPPQKENFKGQ